MSEPVIQGEFKKGKKKMNELDAIAELKYQLSIRDRQIEVLVEALEKIAHMPGPTYNGERVWTLSEFSQNKLIASEALSQFIQMKEGK